jgi:hypothetical protein
MLGTTSAFAWTEENLEKVQSEWFESGHSMWR